MCPTLVDSRLRVVVGEGNGNAPVLLIGEAPGAVESVQQRPFVGPAGKILREYLLQGLEEHVFITNLLACRPMEGSSNRKPSKEEIVCCFSRLQELVHILAPILILLVGDYARNFLAPSLARDAWGSIADLVIDFAPTTPPTTIVFPTYHPAFIAYRGGPAARVTDEYVDSALKTYAYLNRFIKGKMYKWPY